MFKIKRKFIILICLLPALLSGCAQGKNKPAFIFPSDTSKTSGSANTRPSSESNSLPQGSDTDTPVQSSSDETYPPEEPTSSSEQSSEPPVIDTKTVVYNCGPENQCTITFDGKSITVSGIHSDVFDDVDDLYPTMDITRSIDNGKLTCVLTPQYTDFDRTLGSFSVFDAGRNRNTVFITLSDGNIMFPDVSALVSANDRAVSSVVNASDARTAQYITLDGSRERIPEILGEIQKISDEICKGIESDYEKLRAISRWVSDNIYYDHPIYNKGAPQYCLTLEYMLENRSSICGGYSNMTSALCAAQGIRCLNITGMALNNGKCFLQQDAAGEYHEWNVAEIDGRKIIVDTGWDSGKSINSDRSLSDKGPRYGYFDIGKEVFSFDHKAQTAEYRDYWALVR